MIPEDSMLRRHYLTEVKYKQERVFEDFTLVATGNKHSDVVDFPAAPASIPVLHYVAAGFFVLLLVILF